ncbi:MAG: putative toxin-antitoxin system toxin component, PIN family [Cyanobacteria bacterium P01_A01_bin.3]
MKPRLVVDTSVFVSTLIGLTRASRQLIRQCLQQTRYQPPIGNTLFSDYESLINRPKILNRCPLSPSDIVTLFEAFISTCQWIDTYYLWRPNLTDEADNHLIELAVAGNAEAIATHNLEDFANTQLLFPTLNIVKPETLLARHQ